MAASGCPKRPDGPCEPLKKILLDQPSIKLRTNGDNVFLWINDDDFQFLVKADSLIIIIYIPYSRELKIDTGGGVSLLSHSTS